MYGLTQAELERDARYNPIDAFFDDAPPRFGHSDLARVGYLQHVTAGRLPAVVGLAGRNRSRWYSAYTEQLIDRDAEQVSQRTTQAPKVHVIDPGMACHVLNVDAATLGGDAALVGQVFETDDRIWALPISSLWRAPQ